MKLSIIVPLYNVELYILKCIESLINQDLNFNDYEIIVIDDGSSDSSASIVYQLQKKYNNIYLYHKNQNLPHLTFTIKYTTNIKICSVFYYYISIY